MPNTKKNADTDPTRYALQSLYSFTTAQVLKTCQTLLQFIKQVLIFSHHLYRKIRKAIAEKRTEFHTYKLKEERIYKVVTRICTTPSTLKKSNPKLRKQGTWPQISEILYIQ
jgi:hypothetical protein